MRPCDICKTVIVCRERDRHGNVVSKLIKKWFGKSFFVYVEGDVEKILRERVFSSARAYWKQRLGSFRRCRQLLHLPE